MLPARQCCAENPNPKYCSDCDTSYNSNQTECPECGSTDFYLKRCTNCAELDRSTCRAHGGTHVLTKENCDKLTAARITNGINITGILMCTKTCPIAQSCPHYQQHTDIERYGSSLPRCYPEEILYDTLTSRVQEEYDLDDVADQIMLNRFGVNMVRLLRGEKIIDVVGELVERVRTSPDGTYETWQEVNPISKTVEALDKRVQAWLKELAISRAAREGRKIQIQGNINLTNLLSDPKNAAFISDDMVIDVDLDN